MGRRDRALRRAPRRLAGGATVLLCSFALVTTGTLPAPAAPDPGTLKKRVDRKVDQLEEDLDDTNAALRSAYQDLEKTKDKLPAAQAVLEKARSAAAAAEAAEAAATQELEVARANEAKAKNDLATATEEVAEGRTRIAQFAAQIYQEQGFGQLDVALSSTRPQDFADRLAMVDTVLDVQSQTMDKLTTERAGLTALEDHLTALRADSAEKQKKAEAALAKAAAAREAADAAKVELESLAARQQKQAASFEEELAADKKQLAEMKAEQSRLRKILVKRAEEARRKAAAAEAARRKAAAAARKSRGSSSGGGSSSGSGGSSSGDGVLSRPVRGGWVSSEYGRRFHPIYRYWKLHSGRDYAANCGTPVYAAAGGTVIMSGWGGGYGNRVVIDHGLERGSGLATTYNHLSRTAVGGGKVSRGQLVGFIGTTGTSTGCHLHFETLEDGSFTDPRGWLKTLG